MVKLIQKSGYIAPGKGGGYMKYIATREGVEKLTGNSPATKKQKQLIQKLLRDFPDSKDSFEKEVTAAAREALRESLRQMASASCDDLIIAQKLLELSQQLDSVQGKKVYGYLKKPLKALVDSIVDELAKQPEVARCYDAWCALRDELEGYYKDTPRPHLPLSRQKEFRAIKNMVVREAIQLGNDLRQGAVPDAVVARCVGRLLKHLEQLFRENSLLPTNPQGMRIDSRRRKKLLEKRMALGHKRDDHEPTMTQ